METWNNNLEGDIYMLVIYWKGKVFQGPSGQSMTLAFVIIMSNSANIP